MSNNQNNQTTQGGALNNAVFVQVTGTNIGNPSTGLFLPPGHSQGFGAVPSTGHPVAQYALTLSLTSQTIGLVSYSNTCQLTTVLKDAANTTYSPKGSPTYMSYNDPANGAPSWYKPSVFVHAAASSPTYNGSVASVSSSGLITALSIGQAILEIQFPFGDASSGQDPVVYAQIILNVIQ